MLLSIEKLIPLVESGLFFDEIESALYAERKDAAAQTLTKLMQDAGVQIDREFRGHKNIIHRTGSKAARLEAVYTPVTAARLNAVLRIAHAALEAGSSREAFFQLLPQLTVAEKKPPSVIRQKSVLQTA